MDRKIYDVFAAGRPTARDDLFRALADVLYSRDPDTDKVCAAARRAGIRLCRRSRAPPQL